MQADLTDTTLDLNYAGLKIIYAKDLNGESLDLLTVELAKDLEITLEIVSNE